MNYILNFKSLNDTKIFESSENDLAKKYMPSDSLFIGYNESYWSWEYDSDYVYAFLYLLLNTNELYLIVVNRHVKTGLGAGNTTVLKQEINVGTITKPNKTLIGDILKKYGHERSRAAKPFSRNEWMTDTDQKMSLSELLMSEKVQRVAKINKISKEEAELPANPSTKLTSQYNESKIKKLAILHKKLYLLSETDIDELLNKLLNK